MISWLRRVWAAMISRGSEMSLAKDLEELREATTALKGSRVIILDAPSTPEPGRVHFFVDEPGNLMLKDEHGEVTPVSTALVPQRLTGDVRRAVTIPRWDDPFPGQHSSWQSTSTADDHPVDWGEPVEIGPVTPGVRPEEPESKTAWERMLDDDDSGVK